ncbi:MAG: cell wall-binding repeat-containing protein [Candidatus Aenigmatarchaeota archaeon]
MKKIQILIGLVLTLTVLSVPALAEDVDRVIVASEENYPDAIISAAVSQKLGIPVLITEKDEIPDEVSEALKEYNPTEVTVIGGPAVISEEVISQLESDYNVTRLWGMSRYGTAEEVANHFWPEGADSAILVENQLDEERGNTMGSARNLADGNPVFPIPKGEIPAGVLNQLEELEVEKVKIVATEINENMTSDLESINVSLEEQIVEGNEERLEKRMRNRTMQGLRSNQTLVVAAVANFGHVISAPNLPNSASFLVSSEEEIQDAVTAINERNITEVRVVGKPDLAEMITETLREETDADVDQISGPSDRAPQAAAQMTRQNRGRFQKEFEDKHTGWQERIREREEEMQEKANRSINKARGMFTDFDGTEADERLEEAKKVYQQGDYIEARRLAQEARSQARSQKWNRIRGNQTAVNQEVEEETESLGKRIREMAQLNREFGQTMRQNMTVEERLETVGQFRERHQKKVREIVEAAVQKGRGKGRSVNKWFEDAEENETKEDKGELNEECEEDVEEAQESAEGKVCTQQTQMMECPDSDYVHQARNGCVISYLEEQGWSAVNQSPRNQP